MRFDILSLYPNYFVGPFDESLIGRARKKGIIDIRLVDVRDYAENKYRKVDDRPYGGGPGMVMMPEPLSKAIRSCKTPGSRTIYLSPQGAPLNAAKCRELSQCPHLVVVCGHYEGIDQRLLETDIDEEISIGDYVLSNGCPAGVILVDAVSRFIPDFLGHEEAAAQDSFENDLFDWPHYTRPEDFEGLKVPPVLLSGNHEKIKEWRLEMAIEKTRHVRPDLYRSYLLRRNSSP